MGFKLVIVEEEKHWPRLAPHAPPFDVAIDKPLSALERRADEPDQDYIQRLTTTLARLEKSLTTLIKERCRDRTHPADKCRGEILPILKNICADDLTRDLLAESFRPIAQELVAADAPAMAGALLVALHHHQPQDLRLPDKDMMVAISESINRTQPKSWDSYSGDTGSHYHNGGQIGRYFEDHAAIPLLLLTDPEFELSEEEQRSVRWDYDYISLDTWLDITDPLFGKTQTNHAMPPILLEIMGTKLENEALKCESDEEQASFIWNVVQDAPHLQSRGAQILLDTISHRLFNEDKTMMAEEFLPGIIKMQPDIVTPDYLRSAGEAFIENGVSLTYILQEADKHEHLQMAATDVRGMEKDHIKLERARRYRSETLEVTWRYRQGMRRLTL